MMSEQDEPLIVCGGRLEPLPPKPQIDVEKRRSAAPSKGLGNHPWVVVVGLMASAIGIISFVTGKQRLSDFFSFTQNELPVERRQTETTPVQSEAISSQVEPTARKDSESTSPQNQMERHPAGQAMDSEDPGPIPIAAIAAPFRLTGRDTTYVPVMIEVEGRGLLAGNQGNTLPVEVFVHAMDAHGKIEDLLTQAFGLDLGKGQGILQQSGIKFFGHLDLPPGHYSLRVLVRNGATATYGLRVIPLEVPAFAQAESFLLPPFFPEPGNKWLMIRETPLGGQKDVPYPFILKGQPFIPASMPVLRPGQETQVSLIGYNLDAGEVQLRTQVLDAAGTELASGEMKVLDVESGDRGSPDRLLATFKPPGLRPGEYTLRVTLSAGGEPKSNSAQFLIRRDATAAWPGG